MALIALLTIGLSLSVFIGGFISGEVMRGTDGNRILSNIIGVGVAFLLALTVVFALTVVYGLAVFSS